MRQYNFESQCDLSIVIISFNTLEMTRECVASVLGNSHGLAVETIVVDNNSQDGSVAMIRTEFPEVIIIENSDNKGFAAANNQGFALCNGKYVLLLNSDTVILGDVLRSSVDYLEKHSDVGAMGCQVLNSDRSVQNTCSGYPTLSRLLIMTLALDKVPGLSFLDRYLMRAWGRNDEREVEVISGCYLMIRKEIIETIGVLDERFFFFAEETDWCKRISEAGWRLVFSPVGKIIHHGGGSVNKLSYKRDVLLTAATVRLHRKHGGVVGGITAYFILMFFNLTRAGAWMVLAFLNTSRRARAQHFKKIVLAYKACWPV